MSLQLTSTCAGNDSDGKIWGIEGTNLIIILFGLLISLGLLVLLWIKTQSFSIGFCLLSLIPIFCALGYVFLLRQGKPKGYDTDLIETLVVGKGWMPDFFRRKPQVARMANKKENRQ